MKTTWIQHITFLNKFFFMYLFPNIDLDNKQDQNSDKKKIIKSNYAYLPFLLLFSTSCSHEFFDLPYCRLSFRPSQYHAIIVTTFNPSLWFLKKSNAVFQITISIRKWNETVFSSFIAVISNDRFDNIVIMITCLLQMKLYSKSLFDKFYINLMKYQKL